jgi:hypothetical protein
MWIMRLLRPDVMLDLSYIQFRFINCLNVAGARRDLF